MGSKKHTISLYLENDLLLALQSFTKKEKHKSMNQAINALLNKKIYGGTKINASPESKANKCDLINTLLGQGWGIWNVLYFIQTDLSVVKIGTASDVDNFRKRFEECQRWIAEPKLIGFAFCDRKVEKLIHDLLFSYRLPSKGRELFALEHEVKQHISNWCDWNIYDNSETFEEYLADLEDQDDD
jgi:hypothetical protein